ncbi:MAG: UDP-N-acetylglucosamine 2-epimerase (non-hydrolyzing) [Oscillospiraceae bacterium]|nr:UDP-N-acetylglucosamine 2-epimerase (non-hydrolyzing) [Oscillospiraceae bacterium]
MKKIMLVFGTRPEAIKMCPLVNELKSRRNAETVVCVTGQHREMLKQVLDVFGVKPDYDLDIMNQGQTLFDVTEKVMRGMSEVISKVEPDVILVHGDTTTTFAAALAAYYMGVPVGHVEAGLRTYDVHSPYPEEFNRQAVGSIADYNFAPTAVARDNLLREGKKPESIFVTGNTAIDALGTTVVEEFSHPDLDWADGSRLVILTAHRRESWGEPLHSIFRGIRRVVEEFPDVKVLYPIHLNPLVRRAADATLTGMDRIKLTEPMDVMAFHNFLARSYMILTDSGGIQEEAPSLGKPVLVLREVTERPEGVAAGTLKVIGTKEENIYREFKALLTDEKLYDSMSRAKNPYGDGLASKRIADILIYGKTKI